MTEERTPLTAVPGLAKIPAPPSRPSLAPHVPAREHPDETRDRDEQRLADTDPTVHADDSHADAANRGKASTRDTADASIEAPGETQTKVSGTKTTKSRPGRSASADADGGVVVTTFSIPLELRGRFRERLRTTPDATAAEIILNAIASRAESLSDLVIAHRPTAPTSAATDVFPDAVKSDRGTHTEPLVSQTFRTTARNVDALDRLAKKAGARTRSELITAALRADLE